MSKVKKKKKDLNKHIEKAKQLQSMHMHGVPSTR